MKPVFIKNARIAGVGTRDVYIKDGRIARVFDPAALKSSEELRAEHDSLADGADVTDGSGCTLAPSFVDPHTHLRDPGYPAKETVETALAAAVAGGYRAVTAMPNTSPVTDSPDVIRYILEKAAGKGCSVLPTAALTVGQNGAQPCDYDALAEAGAFAFTDDGKPVSDAAVMREVMRRLAARDYLLISHSEELSLTGAGVLNEGSVARTLGVPGIPCSSEDAAVARDIVLAAETGCRIHIAHVSTKMSVKIIRAAKSLGVRVTAETCPHYISLTDADAILYGVNAKMKPPLRGREDAAELIRGIADGTIDCISTDHAPHTAADKGTLASGAFGITGLQTAFAVCYSHLVETGCIDMAKLIDIMSTAPARILGLREQTVSEGERADLVLLDTAGEFVLTEDNNKSKSSNTPYMNVPMTGRVKRVWHSGALVYDESEDATV